MNVSALCARVPQGRIQRGLRSAAVFAALLLGTISAWGQATTSLRGTITDSSGGSVAGATVTITNTESRIERTATSASDGSYQFLLLPPGTYKLTVTAQGF